MSELRGMELRKAALEATGWKFEHDFGLSDYCRHCSMYCLNRSGKECTGPAVEEEPEFSEPWFLEWCARHGPIHWRMEYGFQGMTREGGEYKERPERYRLMLWGAGIHCSIAIPGKRPIEALGATPSEARARAVVSASGTEKK